MPTPSAALSLLASHPQGEVLARFARDCLLDAAASRSLQLEPILARRAPLGGLTRASAQTPLGNVFDALDRLGDEPSGSALLSGLLGLALRLEPPQGVDAEDDTAAKLVWLNTQAQVEPLAVLDEALGEKASGLWGAVADLVQRFDVRGAGLTRAEAVVACTYLAASSNATARQRTTELHATLRTPLLSHLLSPEGASAEALGGAGASLSGELTPAPKGPVATFFLGLVGWLLVSHLARLVGRWVLQYRQPAQVRLVPQGLQVRSTTTLLGRVLKEREVLIPLDGLARASREVQFPRAGLYAGLTALALGSYFGVSWFIDGVRTASFSLAAIGVLILAFGIGLDFVCMSLLPGRQGRCRLVFVPRRGATTCVGLVNTAEADGLLRTLAGR